MYMLRTGKKKDHYWGHLQGDGEWSIHEWYWFGSCPVEPIIRHEPIQYHAVSSSSSSPLLFLPRDQTTIYTHTWTWRHKHIPIENIRRNQTQDKVPERHAEHVVQLRKVYLLLLGLEMIWLLDLIQRSQLNGHHYLNTHLYRKWRVGHRNINVDQVRKRYTSFFRNWYRTTMRSKWIPDSLVWFSWLYKWFWFGRMVFF